MARFDIYANPDKKEAQQIPFFLDVQNDHVKGLQTRVVIPLWKSESFTTRTENLHPELEFDGQFLVLDTTALGAVPITFLRRPLGSLTSQQLQVQDALDTLFGSY